MPDPGPSSLTPSPYDPDASPSGPPSSTPAPASGGPTSELTVVVTDGAGTRTSWTLSCEPPGGTHPDPAAACAALTTNGAQALPAVPKGQMCSQVYGGAQTATISGTWQGRTVRSSLSLKNGCEIGRWKLLQGLLPPAGS